MSPDAILVVHQKLVLIWKNLNGGIGLSQRYEELPNNLVIIEIKMKYESGFMQVSGKM